MTKRANVFADLVDGRLSPWYSDWGPRGSGMFVTVRGEYLAMCGLPGQAQTYTLTAHQVHVAYNKALAAGSLCCGAVMERNGYDEGCANDADNILQTAIFGKVVFG